MKRYFKIGVVLTAISLVGCTNLEESLNSDLSEEQAVQTLSASQLLTSALDQLGNVYDTQDLIWALQEHSSDEAIGPTRGGDWDDNGVWRVIQTQTMDADHSFNQNTFNGLLNGVFKSTQVLSFNPSKTEAAQARFIRAYFVFALNDLYGQVPIREAGENLLEASRVMTRQEAIDYVISEIEGSMADLPASGPANMPNQYVAKAFLTRAYLNKFVYMGESTAPAADMDKVISYADQVMAGPYMLMTGGDYYKNFGPNNGEVSKELIFSHQNLGGTKSANIRARWFCGFHYNMNPSGWNGFTTLGDFYDTFTDANDVRKHYEDPDFMAAVGYPFGFLEGQLYNKDGVALKDRKGNPLAFTKEVALKESGNNLEVTGIRVNKFQPDYASGDNVDNDNPLIRLGEIYLNKAEAMLRKGDAAGAMGIVNMLRAARNAAPLTSLDMTSMLNERGFELYWEGHRRTDLIRFDQFNKAWNNKPATPATTKLFPIPNQALGSNPNLAQNPGY